MNETKSPNDGFDRDFLAFVLDSIKEIFDFETNGHTKYGPEDIACATLLMCVFNTSAETVQIIESLPSADRILDRMGNEKGLELGEKINQLLKKRLLTIHFPKGAKITVAGDLTENPFYGKKDNPVAMGGKPKAGTKYFLKYLTFSVVVKGHRYPAGFYPLTQLLLPKLPEIIEQEVRWFEEHDLCDRFIFDRGFNDHKIYEKIKKNGSKFLMPFTRNKKLNAVFNAVIPTITKRQKKKGFVLKGYRPKWWSDDYRIVVFWSKVRDKKKGFRWKWVFFITNLNLCPITLLFIYRRRWGIETAYRQVHTLQAFTNSRNYGVRVFIVGLAFLLFATWIHINWLLALNDSHQRHKRAITHPTVNLKRFRISLTLPQMRILIILNVLSRLTEKKEIKRFT